MMATARLEEVALATFHVPLERLGAVLPAGVRPDPVRRADGEAGALVSAVGFRARNMQVRGIPRLRIDCGHVDYRANVRLGDERAVWFLGAAMDSWMAAVLRAAWGMPWRRARIRLGHNGRHSYELLARDDVGTARLEAGADPHRSGDGLDSFADSDRLVDALINPTVGLYSGRRGQVRRYTVQHRELTSRPATGTATIPLFERLGLVEPGSKPSSILLLPDFDIEIHLPPKGL
jgi:hypothetical protein